MLGTPTNPAYYVTTDFSGNFNITGDYSCTYNSTTPADSDQLFLVGLSGNTTFIPGVTPTGGSINPAIGEMAVLGQCPSDGTFAGHLNYIYMNEVSTVAAAYALAGFATNSYSVGSGGSAQAQLGLANAFANANQLYDIQGSNKYGEARTLTPNKNGTVPNLLINTVADVLAACINQTGTSPQPIPPTGGTSCSTLYSNTNSSPDAASAAIYIAKHPGNAVQALYGLVGTQPQFADDLATQPNDFAVGIKYTGSPSLSNPVDVAIDAGGDAWVTSSNGYVSNLSALGVQKTGSPFTVGGANYVALDESGNAWVTSTGSSSGVTELTSTGGTVTCSQCNNADIVNPAGIAVDGHGNAYVANQGGGAVLLTLLGTTGDLGRITSDGTGYSYYAQNVLGSVLNQLPLVSQTAVDNANQTWVSGDTFACTLLLLCNGANVERVNGVNGLPNGIGTPTVQTQAGTVSCFLFLCNASAVPEGVAIDSGNNAWVAWDSTSGADHISKVTTAGAYTIYSGGGLSAPRGVAADGAGNVFVANSSSSASSLSEFTSGGVALSGTSGYGNAVVSKPTNLDIDPSGDVWVVSPGSTGFVTEFLGIATPVARPLSVASGAGTLGATP